MYDDARTYKSQIFPYVWNFLSGDVSFLSSCNKSEGIQIETCILAPGIDLCSCIVRWNIK